MADRPDTLVVTDQEPATLDAACPDATAVIVFHGMGQQVRWETIGTLIDTLDRHGHVHQRSVHTRQAAFTDGDKKELRLGRAECFMASPQPGGTPIETHIYESYWTPITEGAVGTRDVVRFLVTAGWDGIRYSLRDFKRHVLGRLQSYGEQQQWRQFGATLLFVLGLIGLNLITAWRVGRYLTANPRPDLDDYAAGFAQQTHLLWNLELLAVVFGALMIAAVLGKRRRGRTPPGVATVLTIVGMVLLFAVPAVAVAIVVLMLRQQTVTWMPGPLPTFGLVPEGVIAVVSWGGAFLLSWYVKSLLVQYVGDVMVYVTAHQVNRFHDLRDRIQATAARVATTLYRQGGYKRYVFVGHSLGSVIAYDTLNRLILEEEQANRPMQHGKVAALITFGSPLDKTAFVFRTQAEKSPVREAIAATVQPLIQTVESGRPAIPWVNLWSSQDIVSGELNFYSAPGGETADGVKNRTDPDADIPLYAHVQFWENKALADVMARAVSGAPALV
jgi:hypothetical protein